MPDPNYLSLGITPDPRSLGLPTMSSPRALGLTIIFGARIRHKWLRRRGLAWLPEPNTSLLMFSDLGVGLARLPEPGAGMLRLPDSGVGLAWPQTHDSLGLVWSTYVFSFFSLFWQLKCTIIICLFVCCLLGSDTNVRLKGLGSGNHVWCQTQVRVWHGPRPTAFEFGMAVRPKSLGSGLTIKPNSLESCMIVKFKEFKTFSILLIFFKKKNDIDPLQSTSQYANFIL
jgi:hypothetical protein